MLSRSMTSSAEPSGLALYADGVNVHALLMPRAEFRKMVEGSIRNSFMHSFLAKGRLLYTHDRDDCAICAHGCRRSATRDTQLQLAARRDRRAGADLQGPQVAASPAATSTTRRSGSSTPRRRWRRSR